MYLEVLYRIRARPIEHLGCRSLTRLYAFHVGYRLFPRITRARYFAVEPLFRDSIVARYGLEQTTAEIVHVLAQIAQDDERAFGLFFSELDAFLTSHPDLAKAGETPFRGELVPAASSFVSDLSDRPGMFLVPVTVGGLRAAVDGYSLAAIEEGRPECADLEGFQDWVRKELDLKGYFRWEDAILSRFRSDESAAFEWTVRELKAFHAGRASRSTAQNTAIDGT